MFTKWINCLIDFKKYFRLFKSFLRSSLNVFPFLYKAFTNSKWKIQNKKLVLSFIFVCSFITHYRLCFNQNYRWANTVSFRLMLVAYMSVKAPFLWISVRLLEQSTCTNTHAHTATNRLLCRFALHCIGFAVTLRQVNSIPQNAHFTANNTMIVHFEVILFMGQNL